jgi:putative MFS transporter
MQFCLFGMWSALYAYTPELYPTEVRATGTGFASAIGRVGSLIGPYIIGVILPMTGQGGVFALGAGAFVIAALSVLILGEETKGRTLESISH